MKYSYPNNLLDFIFADGSISIHIIEAKSPLQLLQSLSPGGEVQSDDVLLKVQSSVCISVETPENVPRIRRGVRVWEEAGIDALELLLADPPAGTLLEEGLIPGAQFGLCVFGVGLQLFQELLRQSAALSIPHPDQERLNSCISCDWPLNFCGVCALCLVFALSSPSRCQMGL